MLHNLREKKSNTEHKKIVNYDNSNSRPSKFKHLLQHFRKVQSESRDVHRSTLPISSSILRWSDERFGDHQEGYKLELECLIRTVNREDLNLHMGIVGPFNASFRPIHPLDKWSFKVHELVSSYEEGLRDDIFHDNFAIRFSLHWFGSWN